MNRGQEWLWAHLQYVLLAARGRGDLVLAGVAEVPSGALPVHFRAGLPADHCPKDGIFSCRRKKQLGGMVAIMPLRFKLKSSALF